MTQKERETYLVKLKRLIRWSGCTCLKISSDTRTLKNKTSHSSSLFCPLMQAAAGSFPPALWKLSQRLPPGTPPSPPPAARLPSPPGQPRGQRLQHRARAQRNRGLHPGDLRQQWQRVWVLRRGTLCRRQADSYYCLWSDPDTLTKTLELSAWLRTH